MLHRISHRIYINIIFFMINLLVIFSMIVGLYFKAQIIDLIGTEELSKEEVIITINNKRIDRTNTSKEKYFIIYSSENDRSVKYEMPVSKDFFDKIKITDTMPAIETTYKLRDDTIDTNLLVETFEYSILDRINNLFFDLLVN